MKTVKCRLQSILRPDLNYTCLHDGIQRSNQIIFIGYHLIRSYLISQSHQKLPLPEIDETFIRYALMTVCKQENRRGPKPSNLDLWESIQEHYRKNFAKITGPRKRATIDNLDEFRISGKNLSNILTEAVHQMETGYHEHIKRNFLKYLRQFVNQMFKAKHQKLIEKAKSGKKTKMAKTFKYQLYQVKEALINDHLNCPEKYHSWIKKYKSLILPSEYKKSYEQDLNLRPSTYYPYLIKMSKILEDKKLKSFQAIPLRTDYRNKYVTIGTPAIIDLFPVNNKKKFQGNIEKFQGEVWSELFDLRKIKRKGLTFNHQIQTDGFGVSINMATQEEIKAKRKKIARITDYLNQIRSQEKNLTVQEKLANKKARKEQKLERKVQNLDKLNTKKSEWRKKYFSKSLNERRQIALERRLKNETVHIGDLIKVQKYLNELKEKLLTKKFVYVDPGKRSIATMMNEEGQFWEYRNNNRVHETRSHKYQVMRMNKLNKTSIDGTSIKEYEAQLSELSSKTCKPSQFKKYYQLKIKLREQIHQQTDINNYFQKLNWYSYINTKRHDDKVLDRIEEKFGKDSTIIYGDWSGKGRAKGKPSPNVGFRSRLAQRFKVHLIDEYLTSQIHHKEEVICKNLQVNDGKEVKKIHAVLTCPMSNQRIGCINRDRNAVLNMRKIANSLINEQKRPAIYSRKKARKPLTKKLGSKDLGSKVSTSGMPVASNLHKATGSYRVSKSNSV